MSLQQQKTAFNCFHTHTTRLAARLIHNSQRTISLAAFKWVFRSQGDGADREKLLLNQLRVE